MVKDEIKNKQSAKRDLEYYLSLLYTSEIKPVKEEDGSVYYFARIVELPGLHTHGDTLEEAISELEEAKILYFETKLEHGGEIPEPNDDLPSGKTMLRMPKTLHKQLIINAERENVSLNQYIVYKLSK